MRLLDLFCCAGGAAMGYHRAGFDEIVGVDIQRQPRYPFAFVQADALEYLAQHGGEFDAIHASPPCQRYSRATRVHIGSSSRHPNLLPVTRSMLEDIGKPWVIENVIGAPLPDAVMLCGSMFGLGVFRHRLFAGFVPPFSPFSCKHDFFPVAVYGHSGAGANRNRERLRGRSNTVENWREAMGINWMTGAELAEAIPPAYTEYIGRELLRRLTPIV